MRLSRFRGAVWLLWAITLTTFTTLDAPLPVRAHHTEIVRSEPADGAVLDRPPVEVRAWFNANVDLPGSTIAVVGPDGSSVVRGDTRRVEGDERSLAIEVDDRQPGTYVVTWHIVTSLDQEFTRGTFRYTVGGAPTAGAGQTVRAVLLGGVVLTLGVIYGTRRWRRQRRR